MAKKDNSYNFLIFLKIDFAYLNKIAHKPWSDA